MNSFFCSSRLLRNSLLNHGLRNWRCLRWNLVNLPFKINSEAPNLQRSQIDLPISTYFVLVDINHTFFWLSPFVVGVDGDTIVVALNQILKGKLKSEIFEVYLLAIEELDAD